MIKFRPYLVPLVLSGEKNSTWRMFDDKDFQVGDDVSLVNWETLEEFARGKITDVKEKKFGDITEEDFDGHEKYHSVDEMYEEYRRYYGDKVGLDVMVKGLQRSFQQSTENSPPCKGGARWGLFDTRIVFVNECIVRPRIYLTWPLLKKERNASSAF